MRKCSWFALLLAAGAVDSLCAQEPPPQIFFLHLKLESNQVALVSAALAPGKLKQISEPHPAFDLEVTTAAGLVLWTNNVADPSRRHLEYEAPDHPGQILNQEVQLTNTEFSVRVPVFPDAHQVNFFLVPALTETNGAAVRPLVGNVPAPSRKAIGTILLPSTAK